MFDFIGEFFRNIFTAIFSSIASGIQWMWANIDGLISDLGEFLYSLIPAGVNIFFGPSGGTYLQFAMEFINDNVGWVSYFFPFGFVLTVTFSTYAVVGVIRIIRWLLAILPLNF